VSKDDDESLLIEGLISNKGIVVGWHRVYCIGIKIYFFHI